MEKDFRLGLHGGRDWDCRKGLGYLTQCARYVNDEVLIALAGKVMWPIST